MKYALNHPWKFERPKMAFLTGLLQASVVYVIEVVNFALVLASNTHIDIVLNFIVLVIISQFDDFFYQTYTDLEFKKVISGLHDKY